MGSLRFLPLLASLLPTLAQSQDIGSPPAPESPWSYSASLYLYALPADDNYAQPAFSADSDTLHLEARYNYEDLDTASLWAGYNFSFGETILVEFTPMIGAVFGNSRGIAPGYLFSVDWKQISFYTEGEYVFAHDERADSYFYSWSELAVSPLEWLRAGLVAQRTRTYQTEREIQPGLLLGVTASQIMLTGYIFNPGKDDPVFVVSMSVDF